MNFKQKFVTTTAMALSLISAYGRRSYAACLSTGPMNYLCSGTNTTSQTISAFNDVNASTTPGFSVNTNSGPGIQIIGDGNFFFTDAYHSYIASNGGSNAGLSVQTYTTGSININVNSHIVSANANGIDALNNGSGIVSINADGNITGQVTGINARNYGTDLTITTGAGSNITGTSTFGIRAVNHGSGVLTTEANGNVTGNVFGIYARNYGTDMNITTGAGSHINGTSNFGIRTINNGTGAMSVTMNGDVTGNYGIRATNYTGTDLTITSGEGSVITGTNVFGISALNRGTGATSITADGTVFGGTAGIYARNYGTDLSVSTGANSSITGSYVFGINARNDGTGALSINTNGDVHGGIFGIDTRNAGTNLTITTAANTSVSGTSNFGIRAVNTGSGLLSVNANSNVTGGSSGIYTKNYGTSLTIVTGTETNITGNNGNGIYAQNNGSGAVAITANGDVSGSRYGIFTMNNAGTNLSITTGQDSFIASGTNYNGIFAINSGSGTSSLNINGRIAGGRYGAFMISNGGTTGAEITTGEDSYISALTNSGLFAINNGNGDLRVTANGHIAAKQSGIRAHNYGNDLILIAGTDSIIEAEDADGISTLGGGANIMSITVNGDVSAGLNGILARNYGGTDTIITTGTDSSITAINGYGVRARNNGSNGSMSITTNGEVTSNNSAIKANNYGTDLTVTTGEDSSIISNNRYGIEAGNSGTGLLSISANGIVSGGNTGIFARSYSGGSGLSITTGAASSITGSNRYGIDARISTGALSITTNGTVYGNDAGIFARHYGTDLNINVNDGSTVTGNDRFGIFVRHSGSGSLSLTNHGTISGDTGITIRNQGGTSTGIFTDGTIEGTGGLAIYFTPDQYGYPYQSTATPIEIAGGRIIGDVIDTNTQRGFSPVTVSGDFISEGNFQVSDFNVSSTGNFTLSAGNGLYSYNTIDVDGVFNADGGSVSANLSVNNGGTLNVNEDLNLGFGDFTNNGVTSIATGKTLIVDTMMAGTGELRFGFNDVNDHALLTVANGAADLTGQHIVVDVTGVTGLATGEQALIVTGQAPIIGGPGGTAIDVDDTSFLWNFQMVDGTGVGAPTSANDLFLIAGQSAPLNTLTTTTNNLHAANVLMTLQSTTNPELAQIVGNMNGASTQAEFNEVLEAVQPTNDMGESRIAADNTRRLMDMAMTRLDDLRDLFGGEYKTDTANLSQTGTLPEQKTGMQAWAMGFGDNPDDGSLDDNHGLDALNNREWQSASGQYSRQDARGGIDGYKAISGGAAVGIDTGNTLKDTVFGLALSYAHSKIDSNNANRSELSIDGYQAMFYASKNLRDNAYFDFMASYAQNNNDTTRHDVGGVPGLTAKGDFTSREIGLKGKLGQRIAYGDYTLSPAFSLNWLHYMADDYTETGAGGANLSVKSNSLDSLEVGYDLKVSREMKRDDGAILIPQVHAGYYYDVIGDSLQKTSAFAGGGASFATESPHPARHRINMGAGVTWRGTGKWDYSLTYDLDARQDFVGHTAMAKAAFRF